MKSHDYKVRENAKYLIEIIDSPEIKKPENWNINIEINPTLEKTSLNSLDRNKNFKKLSHAIQETKISMINNTETAHPFFWAPFVLIGDVRNNFLV